MVQGHQDLEKSLIEFNKLGFDLFENWDQEQFDQFVTIGFLHSKDTDINFAELLHPTFKSFVKKSLEIKKRVELRKNDIIDFFEFYQCKFHSRSPLIVDYFLGYCTIK